MIWDAIPTNYSIDFKSCTQTFQIYKFCKRKWKLHIPLKVFFSSKSIHSIKCELSISLLCSIPSDFISIQLFNTFSLSIGKLKRHLLSKQRTISLKSLWGIIISRKLPPTSCRCNYRPKLKQNNSTQNDFVLSGYNWRAYMIAIPFMPPHHRTLLQTSKLKTFKT